MRIQIFYMMTALVSSFNLRAFRKSSNTNVRLNQHDDDKYIYLDEAKNIAFDPKLVDFDQRKIIIWRNSSGDIHAYEDLCPHRGVELSVGGKINYQDEYNMTQTGIVCSYHGLIFNSNGACQFDPQDGLSKPFLKLLRVPIKDVNGSLFVEKSKPMPPLQSSGLSYPAGWWAIALSAEVGKQYNILKRFSLDFNCSRSDEGKVTITYLNKKIKSLEKNNLIWIKWGTNSSDEPKQLDFLDKHYSTGIDIYSEVSLHVSIENQLDRSHVEFVHAKSLWPLARHVIDEKIISINQTQTGIKWHYQNPDFYWEQVFPNTYINLRFQEYAMTIIAVPITDKITKMYIRSHRTYAQDPLIAPLVDFLYNMIYMLVISEDLKNTLSQQSNYLKHPNFRDKLYRSDDSSIRFFRSYLKTGFNNGLASLPDIEDAGPCDQCKCIP